MTYEIKTLHAAAWLTLNWDANRERVFEWFCKNGSTRYARWQDEEFRNYMHAEYFGPGSRAITSRFFDLDDAHAALLIRYLNEVVGRNIMSRLVEV